jgi:hypothetical protein
MSRFVVVRKSLLFGLDLNDGFAASGTFTLLSDTRLLDSSRRRFRCLSGSGQVFLSIDPQSFLVLHPLEEFEQQPPGVFVELGRDAVVHPFSVAPGLD